MRSNPADFDLIRPGSLPAVLALLAARPGLYTPIAGGTELMVQFGAGHLRPTKLVDILNLPELSAITATPAEITIGAGVTYTTIRNHPDIARDLPLLALAASWTGAIANQNRGTLGGNIVNASPAADSPPALLVYNAELSLISIRGTRRIPYSTFHTAYKKTLLAPDELILALHLPRTFAGHKHYLRKVGARNAQAISKIALAAVATCPQGIIEHCRIALASVSHGPFRCGATEKLLNGAPLTEALIQKAQRTLKSEIAPLDDIRSTAAYRTQVSANLLAEFLTQLLPTPYSLPPVLNNFNTEPTPEAEHSLLNCCASQTWARTLAANRPYPTKEALLEASTKLWFTLPEQDWLEAFAHHPRIGETPSSNTPFLAHSTSEQATTQQTIADLADELAPLNLAYEQKFGFPYLVFASGRTAPDLLALLKSRMLNTRTAELSEAARQQNLITTLRLERWLQS